VPRSSESPGSHGRGFTSFQIKLYIAICILGSARAIEYKIKELGLY